MKKYIIFLLLISFISCAVTRPLVLMPRSTIRGYLLQKTPIGTDSISVKNSFMSDKNNRVIGGNNYPYRAYGKYWGNSWDKVLIGEYKVIFHTSVIAYYIYDDNKKLEYLIVEEDVDAL